MIARGIPVGLALALALALLIAAILLLPRIVSAEETAAQPFEIDLDVQYGSTVQLEDGAFQLTFTSVQEDSRCPKDVMCIWQGQALILTHVVADGVDQGDVHLQLLASGPTGGSSTVTVGAYTLRLDYLMPYPSASQPTPPEQYMATINVKRS